MSALEIGEGCPVVLLANELDMENRQAAAMREANNTLMDPRNVVGFMSCAGISGPILTDGARLVSRRRLNLDGVTECVDRVVRPIPLRFIGLDGEYELAPVATEIRAKVNTILSQNVAPLTTWDPERADGEYGLFQTFNPNGTDFTRGGFLGIIANNSLAPLYTKIDGKSYVVEVKGAGNATGKVKAHTDDFFYNVVYGGLSADEARREFDNLTRAHEAGLTPIMPLALGQVALDHRDSARYGNLGVVFRLTPSTLRLSHRETPGSVSLETPQDVLVVTGKLVDNFLTKFFQADGAPVFISPASHLENYLVNDMQITETDFEDFRELGSKDLPFVHAQTGGFIDTRSIIGHYFTNFARLDGFDRATMTPVVAAMLQRKLGAKGVEIAFDECETMEDIAAELWNGWLIELDLKARQESGYAPFAMLAFFNKNYSRVRQLWRDLIHDDVAKGVFQAAEEADFGEDERAEKYRELNRLCASYEAIFSDETFTNSQRYIAIQRQKEVIDIKTDELQAQMPDEDLPEVLVASMTEAKRQCEIAARIFGGLDFFADYVDSELDYVTRLRAKGHKNLKSLSAVLRQLKGILYLVRSTNNYMTGVEYCSEFLDAHMQSLYIAELEAFSEDL